MLPLSDILAVDILCHSHSHWELSLLFIVAIFGSAETAYTNEWFIKTTEQVSGGLLMLGKFWDCTEIQSKFCITTQYLVSIAA